MLSEREKTQKFVSTRFLGENKKNRWNLNDAMRFLELDRDRVKARRSVGVPATLTNA